MDIRYRPGFLTFTVLYFGIEQEVSAHYTSIYKINGSYFWNNCEILTNEILLESDIKLKMKFEKDYFNSKGK